MKPAPPTVEDLMRMPYFFNVQKLPFKWGSCLTHEITAWDRGMNIVLRVQLHDSMVSIEKQILKQRGFEERK